MVSASTEKVNAETLQSRLERHGGVGPGFDLLRFTLALLIFYAHSYGIAGKFLPDGSLVQNELIWQGWLRPLHLVLLPMFFALSGFLVMGSLLRLKNIWLFTLFRGFRIFPALIVETCLSAFILGPIFTDFSLKQYFLDPGFRAYLGNILGFVNYNLPGVFAHVPLAYLVNQNLWTLPCELETYFLVILLTGLGIAFSRKRFTWFFVIMALLCIGSDVLMTRSRGFQPVNDIIYTTPIMIYYFFVGCFFYHWREKIAFRYSYLILSACIAYILLFFEHMDCVAPFFVTYSTVALGMMKPPRVKLIETGDYSYGIYLYGFPITQAFMATWPALFGGRHILLFFVAVTCTFLFAAFSWHCIEKPILGRKKSFIAGWPAVLERFR